MGDLDLLIDMGFDKERANIALKQGGSLQNAIDWLEKNQDKSIDEIKESTAEEPSAPTTSTKALEGEQQAHSLVCNECNKKFRTHAEAEFHASKTEHTDFSESIEEIAPLTAEEKKAKLDALRASLAAKRAGTAAQDKEDAKKNEEIRRKSTKQGQDVKEQLQAKERIKEAEAKRREKQADVAARKRILEQIERDKAARRAKAEAERAARAGGGGGGAVVQPVVEEEVEVVKPAPRAASSSAHTEARLRLQMPDGMLTKVFPAETTLFEVAHAVNEESGFTVTSFTTNFPKKTFDQDDFGMTLKETGMVPSAALILK